MKHIKYLIYLIKHKWFVLLAGLKIGCPIWRLLVHDLSKFRPSEWFAYVDYFYDKEKENSKTLEAFSKFGCAELAPWGYFPKDLFMIAWCLHQKRNPHHWQYWHLLNDDGSQFPVGMPREYLLEMVADWAGAGRAITGKWDVSSWYVANKEKIKIRDEDRVVVEELISKYLSNIM